MGDELDRLGITEEDVTRAYERVILKRAADILRKRVPRRSLVARYLHGMGLQEYEIESVIRRLEEEAAK